MLCNDCAARTVYVMWPGPCLNMCPTHRSLLCLILWIRLRLHVAGLASAGMLLPVNLDKIRLFAPLMSARICLLRVQAIFHNQMLTRSRQMLHIGAILGGALSYLSPVCCGVAELPTSFHCSGNTRLHIHDLVCKSIKLSAKVFEIEYILKWLVLLHIGLLADLVVVCDIYLPEPLGPPPYL